MYSFVSGLPCIMPNTFDLSPGALVRSPLISIANSPLWIVCGMA